MSTTAFNDPAAIANYAERTYRQVPGCADMQRMALLLLAEKVPAEGRILVLGAGGGLELRLFAQAQPGWQFDGIDPSAEMLRLAEAAVQPHGARVRLHTGYIDVAPTGPFDAACCLLTMHFITREERRRTLAEVRRRLKPGAPFAMAHFSFPQHDAAERARWLARYAAFAVSSGVAPADAERASTTIGAELPILTPEEDEALLRDAGFTGVALFYAGFGFRGWVACA